MDVSEAAQAMGQRSVASREKRWYECARCEKLFEAVVLPPKYSGRRRYCSEACNQAAYRAEKREKRVSKLVENS